MVKEIWRIMRLEQHTLVLAGLGTVRQVMEYILELDTEVQVQITTLLYMW